MLARILPNCDALADSVQPACTDLPCATCRAYCLCRPVEQLAAGPCCPAWLGPHCGVAYFTEREEGLPPRSSERITVPVANGMVVLVRTRIMDGSFGHSYPEMCWEHPAVIGTNMDLLGQAVGAFLPGIGWPLDAEALGGDPRTLNLLEFVFQKIARPVTGTHWTSHESYAGHRHLQFDQTAGRELFRAEVNQLFASHGIAFSLEIGRAHV